MKRCNHTSVDFARSRRKRARPRGFTLIELVTVITIVGVLSALAIPVYLDYSLDAKKSACKGALGGLRSAVRNYYTWSATDAGGAAARYPAITDLTGGAALQGDVPPNPFDGDAAPNNIVNGSGNPKGTIVGATKGWCYDPTTGHVWANSNTKGVAENAY